MYWKHDKWCKEENKSMKHSFDYLFNIVSNDKNEINMIHGNEMVTKFN